MGNLPIYDIMRADGIYVDAEIQNDTALGRLMHDMFCENPDDMYYAELADRSRYFKKDEHGVMKMCEIMEELREETRVEEKKATILRLLKEGASLHMLAVAVEWPQERDGVLEFEEPPAGTVG